MPAAGPSRAEAAGPARPGVVERPAPRDLGLIAVAVAGVSASGPLIAASAVPALALSMWRNLLAAAVLLPATVLPGARRRGGGLSAAGPHERRLLVLAGALLAAHFAAWIPSVRLTGVASATTLVAAQPVWSALIARRQGHAVPRSAWAGIGVAVAGVAAVSGVDVTVSGRAVLGDALALAGGALAAAYVATGAEVRRTLSTGAYAGACYAVTAALLLPVCLLAGVRLGGYSGADWARVVALTVFAQLLGHSVFNAVLRTTSPTVVSLSILFEAPGATLLATLFLHQHPRLAQVPGLLLLLAGVALVVRGARPREAGDPGQAVPVE